MAQKATKSVQFAATDFPFAECTVDDDDDDDDNDNDDNEGVKKSVLSAAEEEEFAEIVKKAAALGIDVFDPHIQKLIQKLGSVDGELNPEEVDRVLDDEEIEENLKIAEVVVEGIDESTFAAMLNTRIRGDEDSLVMLASKKPEEQRIMLVEAMARDLPLPDSRRNKNDWEEEIVETINSMYGSFTLKSSASGSAAAAPRTNWSRLRQTYLPYICMAMVLLYTAVMYYHDPESYTNYDPNLVKNRPGMKRPSVHEDL